jgi:hypothetical protein
MLVAVEQETEQAAVFVLVVQELQVLVVEMVVDQLQLLVLELQIQAVAAAAEILMAV